MRVHDEFHVNYVCVALRTIAFTAAIVVLALLLK